MLSIYVNNQLLDLQDVSNLNIRLNNTLFDVSKLQGSTSEWSFSFNIPETPNNNQIFNFVNEYNYGLATYDCQVYSDECLLFNGSMIINKVEDGYYQVNLVAIKQNTLEEIFGDMTINNVEWSIPFNGEIVNNIENVFFPLVSYGVFQKKPYNTIGDVNFYTSKFKLDEYVRWFYETFTPSVNVLELIRRLFKQKGYTLTGNVFNDKISQLYMSCNLKSDQRPIYNLGNKNLGSVEISCKFDNMFNANTGIATTAKCLTQDLDYPYLPVGNEYNFSKVWIYDLWSNSNSKVTKQERHYLFDSSSNCIVVPSDGWYKLDLQVNGNIPFPQKRTAKEYNVKGDLVNVELENDMRTDMPVEIQLVKGNSVELIKGGKNLQGTRGAWSYYWTAFPHEQLYFSKNPSKKAVYKGNRKGILHPIDFDSNMQGYTCKEGELLAYDPYVNSDFIMGVSSINGNPAVIKNGYSWNPTVSDNIKSIYNSDGYWQIIDDKPTVKTTYNKLEGALQSDGFTSQYDFGGHVYAIVYLKQNDILSLKAVQRAWENGSYQFNVNTTLKVEAFSPNEYMSLKWQDEGTFPKDLQLGQFLNNEVTVKNFIDNFIKDFNLSYRQRGKEVILNTQKLRDCSYAVDIDVDKANIERLEVPSKVSIEYNINTDEWGYEQTIPEDKLNQADWANYGNKHSFNADLGGVGSAQSIKLDDSYTWFDTFQLTNYYKEDGTKGEPIELKLPVISKFSYMIDGYDYEESMKHDGKSLPYRYWLRSDDAIGYVLRNDKYKTPLYVPKSTGIEIEDYYNIPNYKVMISLKCYLTTEQYKLLSNGANVRFNKDIYKVSKINGYDPTGMNETELILVK